ncbi:GGDEF domain-containing protein [Trinickia symbiotica]|nr:diguanylate cyclase [Trinickia symbiotica]
MLNTLLARMPMGRRFNVVIALALVPILALCSWLLAHAWSAFVVADRSEKSFVSLRAAFVVMEKVSAERGPMNAVLGEDVPTPAPQAVALSRARLASDESIAELTATLEPIECRQCATALTMVTKWKAQLAQARANVDRLARQPRSLRQNDAVQAAVRQMFAVVDGIAPLLLSESTTVARGDAGTLNCLMMARLTAELREQAGRLGSHLTGALAMRRPLTLDEKLTIEHTRGRIDQLQTMLDLRMADHPDLATQAFNTMHIRYFGEDLTYFRTIEALASRPGGADTTTAVFAAHYVPDMSSIVAFRDAILDAAQEELQRNRALALCAFAATGIGEFALLAVLGWIVRKLRREVVSPFAQATTAIRAIACGDLTKEVVVPSVHGEVREMFDAIEVLKATSVERSRLEAERVRLMQELALMAETDPLTRLLNRRAFEKQAQALCGEPRTDATWIALIMFDIDHFKRINDTHGHAVGDEALRLVARASRRHFARSEIVARIGGEEFAVITRVGTCSDARDAAERLREDIAGIALPTDSGTSFRMTASFGIAFAQPKDGADVAHLLKQADRMLYEAKLAGRNRVVAQGTRAADALEAPPPNA